MFGDLIDSCCASLMISPEGKISFYNVAFRSLVYDRLLYDTLPTNILSLFQDDTADKEQLQNMLADVVSQERGRVDQAMMRNVIEVRIPRYKQPEVKTVTTDGEEKKEENKEAKKKQGAVEEP